MVDFVIPDDNETVSGTGGNDTFLVLGNNDTVRGLFGGDSFTVHGNGAVLHGGGGSDYVTNDGTGVYADGGDGNDTLVGLAGGSGVLFGDQGDDTLTGVVGYTLDGGPGTDTANLDLSGSSHAYDLTIDAAKLAGSGVDFGDSTMLTRVDRGSILFSGQDDHVTFTNNAAGQVWTLDGGAGNDQITADTSWAVFLRGGDGNDVLRGGDGQDTLNGGPGNDVLDGGAGGQPTTADYSDAPEGVTVRLDLSGPQDTGGAGIDTLRNIQDLTGSAFGDVLTGGKGDNVLIGGAGDDVLSGGKGGDELRGDAGPDTLTGGGGADEFAFNNISDSTPGAPDLITDMTSRDHIRLSGIDADVTQPGDQAFTVVAHFDGHPGEAHFSYDAEADMTQLSLDVNGDGQADSVIDIAGHFTKADALIL